MRFAETRAASVAMCGNYRAHDVALSLLRMVSNNIGHIGCMSAQQYVMPARLVGTPILTLTLTMPTRLVICSALSREPSR